MSRSANTMNGRIIDDPGPLPELLDPPFFINHPNIAHLPKEVTGGVLLESMRRRLGWPNYAGKRVLDYGCGIRLASTIANLGLEFGQYVGVDSNADYIDWLSKNLQEPRFAFARVDADNPLYRNGASPMTEVKTLPVEGPFDLACMFSVITHQDPAEAQQIFHLLRPLASRLYFTALIKDIDGYREGKPDQPRLLSEFSPALLTKVLEITGWTVEQIYTPSHYQQHAVIAI